MSTQELPIDPSLCMSPELQKTAEDIATQLAHNAPLLHYELRELTGVLPDAVSSVTDPHSIYPEKREATAHTYDRALCQLEPFTDTETPHLRDQPIAERLRTELTLRRGLLENPSHLIPVPDGTYASLPFRMALDESGNGRYSFNYPSALDDMQTRLAAFPDWVDVAINNMQEGIARGHTQSQRVMREVVARLKRYVSPGCDPAEIFMEPFHGPKMSLAATELLDRWPADMSAPKLSATSEEYSKHHLLVRQTVVPAYQKLYEFLTESYLPHCRDDSHLGMWALPDGDQQYTNLLRYYAYDHNATPQDIAGVLEEEWHEAVATLQAAKDEMDEYRDMPVGEFYRWLMESKEYRFGTLGEITAKYEQCYDLVEQNWKRIFNKVPRAAFEVNLDLTSAGAPSYSMPGHDGTPGKFNLPLYELTSHSVLLP